MRTLDWQRPQSDPHAGMEPARGLGLIPMVIEQSGRGERASTSIRACSRSA